MTIDREDRPGGGDKRMLVLYLTRAHSRFLEQERNRLKNKHGLRVYNTEIIQALIEQHKLRMTQMASEDPASVEWFYRYLAEQKNAD